MTSKPPFDAPTLQPLPKDELATLAEDERTKREADHKAQFERRAYDAKYDAATLDRLRSMGVTLTPCEMPDFRFSALLTILNTEAAAAPNFAIARLARNRTLALGPRVLI